jgi:hypothetical protein
VALSTILFNYQRTKHRFLFDPIIHLADGGASYGYREVIENMDVNGLSECVTNDTVPAGASPGRMKKAPRFSRIAGVF